VGLSIAAISFLATILQGIIQLLASKNFFFFDFVSGSQEGESGLSWKQAIIGISWALIGLIACYLALQPRNMARFTVLATAGVKLFVLIAFSDYVALNLWKYLAIIIFAILPILLLLSRSSNAYYGRNQ
jgi:hypothetical protein